MRQAALPQRRREDASHAFIPTTTGATMVDSNFPNYFDLGANEMGQFNGSSPFQNMSQYQQDYYNQSTLNHPSNLIPIEASHSPSTVNGHFSPGNLMSEGSMNGMSNYSTPGMEESYADPDFAHNSNMHNDTHTIVNHFNTSPVSTTEHMGFQNQAPSSRSYSDISVLAPHHQSPISSHRSSPAPQQMMGFVQPNNSTFYNPNSTNNFPLQPFPQLSNTIISRPGPDFSSSPGTAPSNGNPNTNPQLVITAEDCQDDRVESSRRLSNRSHGSKRSNTHLSPFPEDDSSDEELESEQQPSSTATVERTDDGSWLQQNGAVQAGIKPEVREEMNLQDISTLDEIEENRLRSEKNAEVAEWLSHSDVGSEAEGGGPKRSRKKKTKGRRRAKSTNDTPYGVASSAGLGVYSYVPGPGLTLQEPSELDEDEDEESGSEEECDSPIPINSVDVGNTYFPAPAATEGETTWPRPEQGSTSGDSTASQGITSNMAIMRFQQRAKEVDNASLAATLGSRRRNSESDIGSVANAAGISKLLLTPTPTRPENKGARRRGGSFLNNILPSRNNSNKLKRKNSQPAGAASSAQAPKETSTPLPPPRRTGSFGRPKSPRIDTSFTSNSNEARSPGVVAAAASGVVQHAKQIWRSRSRSDLGKTPKSMGLAALMTQHGGPPVPTLASPMNLPQDDDQISGGKDGDEDSGDDDAVGLDGITMDLSVRNDVPIVPTKDGFKYHTSQLNPRLASFLLDRITQEQMKRYDRLVKLKEEHAQAVVRHTCGTKAFCFASGGTGKDLPPRAGNKDPGTPLVGFQILGPGMTEESLENSGETQTVAAQFPSGVPSPPVQRLPAEFECNLCFKVKKFYKPSDWTKHVHEDVQPFTCTFVGCNEPKSFKRKADWVRHENERHRQLEYWTCNLGDCNHTCFRKDNFVQHLVREHKVPEPKLRTGRNVNGRSPITPVNPVSSWQNSLAVPNMAEDDIWALVEKCHHVSTKQPQDEPCQFCGNICTTWKKLTVHLAKHMEQISMPVLNLVEIKRVSTNSGQSMTQMPYQHQAGLPTKTFSQLPTLLFDEPDDMEMGMGSNNISANTMHSYPPFQPPQINMQPLDFSSSSSNLGGSSYPPPSVPARSRASSFGGVSDYQASRQGTTYPPAGFTTQSMQNSNTATHYDGQQLFFQSGTAYVTEPMSNRYLTPASGTPASMGYSPESSVADLQQAYQQY
jgi:hypothetical protein